MNRVRKTYSLIGHSYGGAASKAGDEQGPRVLRKHRLLDRLRAVGATVADLHDSMDGPPKETAEKIAAEASAEELAQKNFIQTYQACRALHDKTIEALEQNSIPLIIGGDHSLSIGSVAAVSNFYARAKQNIGLIWVDTHPDFHTPETTRSHCLYGMSVGFLCGRIPGKLASLQEKFPCVSLENLAYIGLRDVEPGEREAIRDLGVAAFSMKEVDMLGMAEVCRRAIQVATKGAAGYVLSFDLDVCDPPIAPGVVLRTRGGLTYRESQLLAELIYDDGRMLSAELVEYNPTQDEGEMTAELGISLLESLVGRQILL